ncbi:unnamed protein product, partial [Rotaria magnacalcarata]
LSPNIHIADSAFNSDLVTTVQEITNNNNSRRSLTVHTTPYSDRILNLPFVCWSKVQNSSDNNRHTPDEGNY